MRSDRVAAGGRLATLSLALLATTGLLRALALAAVLLVPAVAVAPVFAEDRPGADASRANPPDQAPQAEHGDHADNLDTLFAALKIAPDEESARAIEARIWTLWTVSGSDTCDLLMSRAKAAADDKDYDLAIKLLNAVIELKPDYAEGWNRRATVYFLKQDYAHSLADIGEVLAREPRHFGALSGLGLILQEIGDDKHALEAYRRALAIDPHLDQAAEAVKTLSEKVEGQPI